VQQIIRLVPIAIVVAVSMAACAQKPAAQAGAGNDERAVRDALEASRTEWNNGNFEGCMRVYWNSPDLTLWSGADTIRGYAQMLEYFRLGHMAPGREMGQIEFDNVFVDILAPDAALVRGAWRWKQSGQKAQYGVFTVLMRKFPDGWKTVHEHSSGPIGSAEGPRP
jgi:ketosteroid isomerase-like protein